VIPNHILNNLTLDDRVSTLARGAETHSLVHPASDDPDVIRVQAEPEGAEVLSTHMRDQAAILEFVASRGRDVGGEG
jgi:hypothetical protein